MYRLRDVSQVDEESSWGKILEPTTTKHEDEHSKMHDYQTPKRWRLSSMRERRDEEQSEHSYGTTLCG
jgi:hypothetical protein